MPYRLINYTWSDYNPHTMQYVDDWLDERWIISWRTEVRDVRPSDRTSFFPSFWGRG